MIKRELYLKKIRDSYDSELIKVIMGIRRLRKICIIGTNNGGNKRKRNKRGSYYIYKF